MKYEEYIAKREELMNAAQTATNEGNFDEAQSQLDAVDALDNQWDKQAQMEANMNALAGKQRKLNVQNLGGQPVAGQPVENTIVAPMTKEAALASDAYTNAWAKFMQGKNDQITKDEASAFRMVNEEGSASADPYVHTTGNTGLLIPQTVANGIWKEIGEKHPYYADALKTFVKGAAIIIKAKESSPAKWYVESVKTEDGRELFDKMTLNGCELARAITVSWKLKEMAIADFIPYITSSLAEEMGKALGYGMIHGAGIVEGHAPEPLGVVTALSKENSTPQIVEYPEAGLTYAKLIEARSKIKSGYTPAVYVNANTMWTVLAALVDANGRPILMSDVSTGTGVYRVLGCVVKEEDGLADGEILFSEARQYQININKQVSLTTEEHNKERLTDYCAYAIVDGAPITNRAHALLKKAGE